MNDKDLTLHELEGVARVIVPAFTELSEEAVLQLPAETIVSIMSDIDQFCDEHLSDNDSDDDADGDHLVNAETEDEEETLWRPWQELLKVNGINEERARNLWENDYGTVTDLMDAEMDDLVELDTITPTRAARIKTDVDTTRRPAP